MWEFRIAKMYTVQGEICNTDNKALKQVLQVQILNSGESRLPPATWSSRGLPGWGRWSFTSVRWELYYILKSYICDDTEHLLKRLGASLQQLQSSGVRCLNPLLSVYTHVADSEQLVRSFARLHGCSSCVCVRICFRPGYPSGSRGKGEPTTVKNVNIWQMEPLKVEL